MSAEASSSKNCALRNSLSAGLVVLIHTELLEEARSMTQSTSNQSCVVMAVALLVTTVACKRQDQGPSGPLAASLIFDNPFRQSVA